MPVGLSQIVERVVVDIHAAGRHLVQQRLPEMGARALDQRDIGPFALAQLVTQSGRQFQAGGTPADDDDVVQRVILPLDAGAVLRRLWRFARSTVSVRPDVCRGVIVVSSATALSDMAWHSLLSCFLFALPCPVSQHRIPDTGCRCKIRR